MNRAVSLFMATICVALYSGRECLAQGRDGYVGLLSERDARSGARAKVEQDALSSRILSAYSSNVSPEAMIAGFRICLFFDNGQSARAAAHSSLELFRRLYPGMSTEVIYKNPVFKTLAGYCLTRVEASYLLGKIKQNFPKAFIVNERIPLSSAVALNAPAESLPLVDTTSFGGVI